MRRQSVGPWLLVALSALGGGAHAAESTKPSAKPPHQVGKKPSTPLATLPEGVPLGEPRENARRSIAEGAPEGPASQAPPTEERAALEEVDRVLFPEPLRGISSSWSFDLPEADDTSSSFGLPPLAGVPSAEHPSDADTAWLATLTLPDLPVRLDQRVVTYLKFYRDSPRGRTTAAIWARTSGRFVAAMKAELRRAKLPADLVWLSMIESSHNPTAKSGAGALGLWQFMPESARMYGLTVDAWVDERRDPARSTEAAVRFLSDLHQRFGNWELAMGAYNMGYAGMSRAIAKYNTNDFWTLARLESGIPWETTLYVAKISALAIVMNNRDAFGIGRIKPDPAVTFDTILVEPGALLLDVASAAKISLEELRQLNPAYLATRTPPSGKGDVRFRMAVPRGRGEAALAALSKRAPAALSTVRVRLGDTFETIAADHGISASSLLKHNGLADGATLAAGTVLLLPSGAKRAAAPAVTTPVVVSRALRAGQGQKLVYYDVRAGDELDDIAVAFGVPTAELVGHNALDPRARLREGMTLQVLVDDSVDLSSVRHFAPSDTRPVLVAGSPEFHEYFEGLGGKRRALVLVKKGDTLAKIGARFGMSVGSMERVNRRDNDSALVPGERVIVYTQAEVESAVSEGGQAPLETVVAPRPDLLPGARSSR